MLALDLHQRYRVVHRSPEQRVNRVSVMTYLGDGFWDARPAAGTQRLPWEWIKRVEPVSTEVPHSLNQREK